jgi:hypothetical protein
MFGYGNIEDQQIVQARRWAGTAVSMMCEFQVVGTSRQTEHHAIVSVVIGETIEFGEAKAIPVKVDDLLQAVRWPRDTNLRDEDLIREFMRGNIGRYGQLSFHVLSVFQAVTSDLR